MPRVDQFLLRKITTYSTRSNFLLQTLPFITYSFSWEPGTCNKLKRLTNIVSKTGSTSVFWILQRARVNNNYIKILLNYYYYYYYCYNLLLSIKCNIALLVLSNQKPNLFIFCNCLVFYKKNAFIFYKTAKRTQTVVKHRPKIFLELNSCQTTLKFRKRKNFLDVLLSSIVA